jgi:glycosyltransferase involved in cell wall biosynthesis
VAILPGAGCLDSLVNILVLSQYFPPEIGATQLRAQSIAEHLASMGHRVTVITELPNHPAGRFRPDWPRKLVHRRREDGYDVFHCWVHASPKKTLTRRLTFYLSYALTASAVGLALGRRRADVIVATSPPLPVLISGAALGTIWRRPLVADVRDVWPAVGVDLGEAGSRPLIAIAELVERICYRRASAVTTVTAGFAEHIVRAGADAGKVHVVPNGPLPRHLRRDDARSPVTGLENKFVVGYIGLHGVAKGLEVVLDAADLMRSDDGIVFLFVGDGPTKESLVSSAAQRQLPNVKFVDAVPPEQVQAVFAACDVTLVPLKDVPANRATVPVKLFDSWLAGTPVILMARGESEEIVRDSGGGIVVAPGDAEALCDALMSLRSAPTDVRGMGDAGRRYVLDRPDREDHLAALDELLLAVCRAGR